MRKMTMMLMLSVAVLLVAASAQAALVSHFAMNENTGTTTADSVAGNDGGTLTANVGWSTDTPDSSTSSLSFPDFSTAGSYVSVSGSTPGTYVSPTSAFSVSVWFKTDDITGSGGNKYPTLATLSSSTGNAFQIVLSAVTGSPGYAGICIGSAGSTFARLRTTDIADPEATLGDNKWHNVIVSFDGEDATAASSYAIYLDDVSRTLGAASNFGSVNNSDLVIGGVAGRSDTNFNGLIDDLKVYDTVIPEPATMSLLGIGGLLALVRRRRK